MNTVIAHEHFLEWGGGEYVANELAELFDAPIHTGGYYPENLPERDNVHSIIDGWIGHKLTRIGPIPRDAYYFLKWPNADLEDYDVIIQSGNNPGWYVPTDTQTVVKYVHSTPRGSYDLYQQTEPSLLNTLYQHAIRALYSTTLPYPDVYVANSDLVARRIRRYWGIPDKKIEVVYPPVKTSEYSPADAATQEWYFTWGRLYDHKNVDLIVEAFNELDHDLYIAGTGPERDPLERLADDNIHFLGWLEDDEIQLRASAAKAVIFAGENEDFGLVPVEAMAAGTPILGIDDGFTKHQILEGRNGLTFEKTDSVSEDGYTYTSGSLAETVCRFERDGVAWSEYEIAEWADEQFGLERFGREMRAVVEDAVGRARVRPRFEGEP